jgi:hypothetical protein
MEIEARPSSPSRHNDTCPKRPGGNYEGGRQRRIHGTSFERRRKRSRSRSHDRERAQELRDPSPEAHVQRPVRESRLSPAPQNPRHLRPHPRTAKGKGKSGRLGESHDQPRTFHAGGSGTERATIDKILGSAQTRELPNAEHTVIGISKRGNRDRAPKALTLRQSVQAHLSLQKTEPVKVSRSVAEPESATLGPNLRHGRPSLLERISGMEGIPHSQPTSVSAVHPDVSASPESGRLPRSAVAQRERHGGASSNINVNYAEEDIIDIDSHRRDPISNIIQQDNAAGQAGYADRTPRVDPKEVLERTRVRLAKMKNVMVAGIPPTAPTPPPIPLDPSTPGEPEETVPPAPMVATLRNKLLERLESERERAIGAASVELGVEPVGGNISEDSLRAELRARNQLRTRLAVGKADRHVGNLEA